MRARSDSSSPVAELPDACSPLQPTILETFATRGCPENPKYLVDKISINQQRRDGRAQETFRIWLSDGQQCVQAILHQRAHHFITSGDLAVGSLVRLLDYEVKRFPRASGLGYVSVFAVSDLCVEDHDGRLASACEYEDRMIADQRQTDSEISQYSNEKDSPSSRAALAPAKAIPSQEKDLSRRDPERPSLLPPDASKEKSSQHASPFSTPRKRKTLEDSFPLSPLDPNIPSSHGRARKRQRRKPMPMTPVKKTLEEQTNELRARLIALQSTPTKQRLRAATETPSPSPSKQMRFTDPSSRKIQTMPVPQQSPSLAPCQTPVLQALTITPLVNITGVKATRNKVHDVLVIITHVNPRVLTRKGFPDSRELLVMDTSTAKQVHVTVFIDAANFRPEVGTVAVFRSMTTHEWNGGSLKAYAQRCAGMQWYVPEYPGWQWEEEGEELRACLESRPEAKVLPDRIWWTERGHYGRS